MGADGNYPLPDRSGAKRRDLGCPRRNRFPAAATSCPFGKCLSTLWPEFLRQGREEGKGKAAPTAAQPPKIPPQESGSRKGVCLLRCRYEEVQRGNQRRRAQRRLNFAYIGTTEPFRTRTSGISRSRKCLADCHIPSGQAFRGDRNSVSGCVGRLCLRVDSALPNAIVSHDSVWF
jgi:hypothetical protein